MSGVRIVTDSACDLSDDDVTKHGIAVVPLSIRFGTDEYVDREELSVERFYALMDSTGLLPETAAPSPGRFEQAFRAAADDGADAVVCINLSSALSATMQSAQAAAKALEGQVDVRVIDSRSITGGLGTMVLAAAEQAAAGADADAVVALVEAMIPRSDVYGALNTLDNLKKGGRIGGAQAMLGSMLSVKPLIRIVDGAVAEAGKPRTRKRALEALRDKLEEAGAVESVAVLHGEAGDIDEFLDMISHLHPRDTIRVGKIGAVIGAHGGPGVIGVCFLHPAT
ncbi:MAG: DegV family protein [Acidimicrobiales bacterium]|jgi:DegV family protein with EDD domain|nr:DegV family protein [Acidimicrobiales bacterium]